MPTTTTVATRAAMAALTPSAGDSAILTEANREGLFRWSPESHSDGAHPIANHLNTTVTDLGQGWFGLQKTTGATNTYNASATSAHGAAGAVAIRLRPWNSMSFDNVIVGFNTSPNADDSDAMTVSIGVGGGFCYISLAGSTVDNPPYDRSRYDILLYRDTSDQVKVYLLPRTMELVPNAIAAQLSDPAVVLLYTFASSISGTLFFDSSIYSSGAGAQIQFLDVAVGGTGLVSADAEQGVCVAPVSDSTGASGAWLRVIEGAVKVGWFGAKSDGTSNDTSALASAAAYIRRVGGGTLELEPRTYVIGAQTLGGSAFWAHEPAKILYFSYCHRKVTVIGNGCTLLCAADLKYGQFDPASGSSSTGSPVDLTYRSSPFEGAIFAEFNDGDIEINGVNVDGNLDHLTIGGSWGDQGIQIPFDGFRLYDNTGRILIRNCKAYRLGLDGLNIRRDLKGKGDKAQPTLIEDFEANECGRQGATFAGARILTVVNSQFLRTGRNAHVSTAPRAGVDIEPDSPGYADEILFLNCIAAFNAGDNLGVAAGRDSRILWKGGRLVGTESYALWLQKPGIRFEDALIVGAVRCAWQDDDARGVLEEGDAPNFVRCTFSDNTEYSSVQENAPPEPLYSNEIEVYFGRVWFQRCRFDYRRTFRLPNIDALAERAVFENCDFHCDTTGSQTASHAAIWLGLNTFSGIGLSYMPYFNLKDVGGTVRWAIGGSGPPTWGSIAGGDSATTTVAVDRARVGDGYEYEAHMLDDDQNNAGLTFTAAVTADDTVTVTATNGTSAAVTLAPGTLIVEVRGGRRYFEGSETYNWPSIGAGTASATPVDVPGARVGDRRVYRATMSNGWGSLIASCEPTADDTVTVTAFNPTGSAIDLPPGTLSVIGVA